MHYNYLTKTNETDCLVKINNQPSFLAVNIKLGYLHLW